MLRFGLHFYLENQILDLRKLAAQRGVEVFREYCDKISSEPRVADA
jgi:hypothetical protein